MDFRLTSAVYDFMVAQGLKNNYDQVCPAGGVLPVVRPKNERDREFILEHIGLSMNLHGTKTVYLINHTDCGAYGGKQAFASEQAEKEQHTKDLKEAKKIVLERFPELEVKLFLGRLKEEEGKELEIDFEVIV